MTRIALITTGDCEQLALADSLKKLFPTAEFVPLPRRDGFTSVRLTPELPVRRPTPTNAQKLARALVAEVASPRGRDRELRPDFAIAVDDVELCNIDQVAVVTKHFSAAVGDALDSAFSSMSSRERNAGLVRERCSFHMLCPMVEAYFFGEPGAVVRAGVSTSVSVCRRPGDLEAFEANDPSYLGERLHPKRYLEFLCERSGTFYRESEDGRAALRDLAWREVLAVEAECRLARSLIQDIEDMLELALGSTAPGHTHQSTRRRDGGMLRNLDSVGT